MTHALRPLSSSNPRIKLLGRLARHRGERHEQRALLVEGPTLIATAIEAGAEVREVYVAEERSGDPALARLLDRLPTEVPRWSVESKALERAGDATTSQGVLAVVEHSQATLPRASADGFVLVLAEVADPGNTGTVIRAAVASGADAVVVASGADPTAPKVVRASAGACFHVPVIRRTRPSEAFDEVRRAGYRLMGAVVEGGRQHDSVDLTGPVAIVVGNEARGLSEQAAGHLDERLTIPMAGPTESLNVAMAATVLSFEVLRQRRQS